MILKIIVMFAVVVALECFLIRWWRLDDKHGSHPHIARQPWPGR